VKQAVEGVTNQRGRERPKKDEVQAGNDEIKLVDIRRTNHRVKTRLGGIFSRLKRHIRS